MSTITITSALTPTERQRIRRAISSRNAYLNPGEAPARYCRVDGHPAVICEAPRDDQGDPLAYDASGRRADRAYAERQFTRSYARQLMCAAGRTFDYDLT